MATLPAEDKAKIVRGLMRYWSKIWVECVFSQEELGAAVDDLDVWFDDNAAAANQAIPLPFRTDATSAQKALMTIGIVTMRYGDDALLDAILGGVK